MGEVEAYPLPLGGAPLRAPEAIGEGHDLLQFDCGKPPLDEWLRKQALRSNGLTARTYVVCSGAVVVSYYCLSTGAVARETAPGKLRRNTPDQIPIILLGRLAVDQRYAGRGLGRGMLRDAMQRILSIEKGVGVRALLVHAIDTDTIGFYTQYGFTPFEDEPRTLYLPIETIEHSIRRLKI